MTEIEELRALVKELNITVNTLKSDVRDLSTHVEYLKTAQEESKKKWWNISMAAIGVFLSAVGAWIFSGGLSGK